MGSIPILRWHRIDLFQIARIHHRKTVLLVEPAAQINLATAVRAEGQSQRLLLVKVTFTNWAEHGFGPDHAETYGPSDAPTILMRQLAFGEMVFHLEFHHVEELLSFLLVLGVLVVSGFDSLFLSLFDSLLLVDLAGSLALLSAFLSALAAFL